MDWKQLIYKVVKGALGGAAAALATLQIAGVEKDKLIPLVVSVAIGGALHGVANALEQKKAGGEG